MTARIVFTLMFTASAALAQRGAFQMVEEDGRPVASYYGVEPHLHAALNQMSGYFAPRKGQAFRVWEDNMMPLDLKDLNFEPGQRLMRRWFAEFFKDQVAETGLIPLGGLSRPSERLYTILDQSKCFFLGTMSRATPFLDWFPNDAEVHERCLKMAEGFLKYCRAGRASSFGLFPAVRADTGFPESDLVNVTSYGSAIAGLTRIGTAAKRQDLLDAAKGIATWVSNFSTRYCAGIVPEKFHAVGGCPTDLSSDGIYWIRALGKAYETTGDGFYRDLILRHGNVYYEHGWQPDYQHFITTVVVDGEGIHPTGNMRGDTKYNYPHLLCLLTRLTHNPKYMERFDALWATYLREACDGWMPNTLDQGHRTQKKSEPPEDKNQSIYLQLLLEAHEATNDPKYLAQAGAWAEKLLTPEGEAHWRGDSVGTDLIRYARRAKLVSRLEVRFTTPARTALQVVKPDGSPVFSEQVDTPIAVLYLAPGRYVVRAAGCVEKSVELLSEEKESVALGVGFHP